MPPRIRTLLIKQRRPMQSIQLKIRCQGMWGLKATGTDIPPEGEQYNLIVAATSDSVINLLGFEPSYTIGDTVRIGVRARRKIGQNIEPILAATTSAEIVRPDGSYRFSTTT